MNSHDGARLSMRQSKRHSVTALYLSMSAKEKDLEIEDDLARGSRPARPGPADPRSPEDPARAEEQNLVAVQKELRLGKGRALSRFAHRAVDPEPHGARRIRGTWPHLCLPSNRDQREEVASHLEDNSEIQEGAFPNDEKTQKYGNLLFLLQSEPRHIAHLSRLVSMTEIDSLLQTVMFTIYGNQYESREEYLLLTMFQVRSRPVLRLC
jgi:Ras GTPase-activating-like protein IQGAP2/3